MVVEIEPDLPHGHCDSCYSRHCQVSPQPGNACSLMDCEADCGARFHRCKEAEHRLLCPNMKTECVNAIYGCPVDIQRRHICNHLEVCPASVINCTMEWNRWPVYASERQQQQPLLVVPDNLDQLDIALALRDQRMLTKSMKASKRTRQILTNALNRRHPAVPLSAQLTNSDAQEGEDEQREIANLLQAMQDEKEAADCERARTPPGLQRSICNELYRTNPASSGTVAPEPEAQFAPFPKDPFIHCSHCTRRKEVLERIVASKAAMQDSHNGDLPVEDDPSQAWTPILEQNGFPQDDDGSNSGLHHYERREDEVLHDGLSEVPSSLNSTFSSEDSDMQTPAVFVTQSTTGDVSAAPTRGHSKPIIIQPPAVTSSANKTHRLSSSSNGSIDSRHSLSLDLSLESITRYQAKPDSMYTFLCAQEFRRDEYPYHFQNVHSDIHGGLNGWMEQRCPLAPYGCTYSQRRLYPGSEGAHIVHSENLESFGLCVDGDRSVASYANGLKDGNLGDLEMKTNGEIPLDDTCNKDKLHSNDRKSKCNGLIKEDNDSKLSNGSMDIDDFVEERSRLKHNSNVDQRKDEVTEPHSEVHSQQKNKSSTEDSSKASSEMSSRIQSLSKDVVGNHVNLQPETHDQHQEKSSPDETSETQSDMDEASHTLDSASMDNGVDRLSQLPFELLRYLLRFLDSFTINHLAMTSKLLRQVSCSLLEERGMVVLQWEKHRGRWETTMKVWHFSTAFTPVKSWGFQDNPPIAEHLKRCPYNVRNMATKPVKVMGHEAAKVKLESANDPSREREAESVQPFRPRYRRLRDCDDDW